MYKYFTWSDTDGYFHGQDLLTRAQIAVLLHHQSARNEYFATVQDYDADGRIVGCPIYFDIDSPSLYDAHAEMQALCYELEADFQMTVLAYFSGSKGFHVIIPLYVRHERCHEIVEMITQDYKSVVTLDDSVYRTRSMWRCDNTWNQKGNTNKRRIRWTWSLDDIIAGRTYAPTHKTSVPNMTAASVDNYAKQLPDRSFKVVTVEGDFDSNLHPCMRKLWESSSPPEGQRNHFLHIMARHCFRSGLSVDEALSIFSEHHLYSTFRNGEYVRVVKSVYRSGNALIGCKSGRDAKVLQPQCHGMCPWREQWRISDVFKTETVLATAQE